MEYYLSAIRPEKNSWLYSDFYCDLFIPTVCSGATVPPKRGFLCKLQVESQSTREHHTGPEYIYLP